MKAAREAWFAAHPTVARTRNVYDVIATVDITRSMNVRDLTEEEAIVQRRRHHSRPAPDRRPGAVPPRGQPGGTLRQLFWAIVRDEIAGCPLEQFEAMTGLSLTNETGGLLDELPPVGRFLKTLRGRLPEATRRR